MVKNCAGDDLAGTTVPFSKWFGIFRAECAPDTLYSWQKPENVEAYAQRSSPKNVLPIYHDVTGKPQAIFTWRTPLGSFAYGRASLRIKLRDGVKFIKAPDGQIDCEALGKKYDLDKIVFVGFMGLNPDPKFILNGYSEYVLCSDGPVHSWSNGTTEHLREIQNEKKWIETYPPSEYDSLIRGIIPWSDNNLDEKKWTKDELEANLSYAQSLVDKNKGRIFFAEDVKPDRSEHFRTKRPSYFHP